MARTRTEEDSIVFNVADVARADPPAEPYDRLVSRFGIMFFDDPDAAFSNLASWLGPRGRFAFAVWGPAPDNPWMSIIRESVGTVIDVPPPDPEAPGPFRYGGGEKLLGLLAAAGLGDLDLQDWQGDLPLGGGLPANAAADFALESLLCRGSARRRRRGRASRGAPADDGAFCRTREGRRRAGLGARSHRHRHAPLMPSTLYKGKQKKNVQIYLVNCTET